MDKTPLLIDIAHQSRKDCEFYLPHYPELAGVCGICSLYLLIQARQHGIYTTLCYGLCDEKHHWWVEYNNKIIDITATQFGYTAKVRVKNKNKQSGYRLLGSTRSLERARQWTQHWLQWIPEEMLSAMDAHSTGARKGNFI